MPKIRPEQIIEEPMATILEQLAEFSCSLKLKNIPTKVVDHAKLCIMDAIECCVSSETDNRKTGSFASVEKNADLPCSLFGTEQRAGMADAAFYNTVSGAIAYRNDVSIVGKGHPGSIVIPTALALAEGLKLDGKTMLEAVIVGYEIMIRFGSMLGHADFPYAFRPTAFVAPVGSAFVASKAMGLSVSQTVSAASLAFNCAAGFNEWADAGTGEDVIQNGNGARAGILCALQAKNGVLGAPSVIEGKFGFNKAYHTESFVGYFTENLGETYYLTDTRFKQIPACMNVQNVAQLADRIAKKPDFNVSEVSSILIEMTQGGKDWPNGDKKDVETLIHATMSLPYTTAATLIAGDCDKVRFAPPYSDDLRKLIDKIEVIAKPKYTAIQRQHQVIGLSVLMNNGKKYFEESLDARTLTDEEVVNKFTETIDGFYGKGKGERLRTLLSEIETQSDMGDVLGILGGKAYE